MKVVLYISGCIVLAAILASCSGSNEVTSSGFIQKRKYMRGYYAHAVLNNNKHSTFDRTVSSKLIKTDQELKSSPDQSFIALNNSDQDKLFPEGSTKIPAGTLFLGGMYPLIAKADTNDIIVTTKGDTIICRILRATSMRIYYKEIMQGQPVNDNTEYMILRSEIKSVRLYSAAGNNSQEVALNKPMPGAKDPPKVAISEEEQKARNAMGLAIAGSLLSLIGYLFFFSLFAFIFIGLFFSLIGFVKANKIRRKHAREESYSGKKIVMLAYYWSLFSLLAPVVLFLVFFIFFMWYFYWS